MITTFTSCSPPISVRTLAPDTRLSSLTADGARRRALPSLETFALSEQGGDKADGREERGCKKA